MALRRKEGGQKEEWCLLANVTVGSQLVVRMENGALIPPVQGRIPEGGLSGYKLAKGELLIEKGDMGWLVVDSMVKGIEEDHVFPRS